MHCTVKIIRLCFKSCYEGEGVLPVSCQFIVLIYVSFIILTGSSRSKERQRPESDSGDHKTGISHNKCSGICTH